MINKINQLAKENHNMVVEWRRCFHANPELSFQEFKTAKRVSEELTKMGIEHKTEIATTGVVGIIKGKYPGKTIMIRGDMDALPVEEKADVPYRSTVSGVMHACGHDAHTAGLLGVAKILNELKNEMHGNVVVLFQPGEENGGGAKPMIEAGVLKDYGVDAAIGCHFWGNLEEGFVGTRSGAAMAGVDNFYLTMVGNGGHGATPHLAVDPVVMAAEFVMQAQTVVSRRMDPLEPCVITCGTIHGGTQHNVIPGDVKVTASVRTMSVESSKKIEHEVEKIASGIAKSYGGNYIYEYKNGFPALINDETMTQLSIDACKDIVGSDKVITIPAAMGSEDFAFFAQQVPSTYFFIGIQKKGEGPELHHNSLFKMDDENLMLSTQCLAWTAWRYLHTNIEEEK